MTADGVLELATLLSVATRIEPELIRAMRLSVRPQLDVGIEADLWFSELVTARGPDAIMLDPDRLPELRARLAELDEQDDGLLDRVWNVLDHVHGDTLSPALFLEERVTWLAIANQVDAAETALRPALHALVAENRTGVADWLSDAWSRLPAAVHATITAWQLATVASTGATTPRLTTGASPGDLAVTDVATIADALPDVSLAVRLDGSHLTLGDTPRPGAAAVLVPDTDPRVIQVESANTSRAVRIPTGHTVRVRVGAGPVRIRTPRGAIYELRPEQPSAGTSRPHTAVEPSATVQRTVMIVDVEGFANRSSTHQAAVRRELHHALHRAFQNAEFDRSGWDEQDIGNGVLMLGPPGLYNEIFAERLPHTLAGAVREHNEEHSPEERLRLRMVLHAGEVSINERGMTGEAVILASRLLGSSPLRAALAESSGVLALAVSSWFYENVVSQHPASAPETYRRIMLPTKESDIEVWIRRPDDPYSTVEFDSPGTFDPVARFEHRYVNYVREDSSVFELFQVDHGRPVGNSFDEFYVVPSIAPRQSIDTGSGLTSMERDPVSAITEARRILLIGGPGAGKTTLLRWLAYFATTQHHQMGSWHRTVPFFVSLRRFDGAAPPSLEELLNVTVPMLRDEKPEGWITRLFAAGRAMLLVDGLDELATDRRETAKRWLEVLMRSYPDARYVISTRPSAIDEGWLADGGNSISLARFELLPLSSAGLQRVVDRWYAAALSRETDPEQQAWLTECGTRLREELSTRPNLRSLVSSPLLAGLICDLYRREYPLRTRRELFDQILDLLLVRWEELKGRERGSDKVRLAAAEMRTLLERLAAPMVRGSELWISRDYAIRRLGRAMEGLRSQYEDPEQVLDYLLVRTGLLRETRDDRTTEIRFANQTFRDYLAAGEIVKAGEFGVLVENADRDFWHQVVFMVAMQARARERAELLTRLLKRARDRDTAPDVAVQLKLVAAACLGYADIVESKRVLLDVQDAVRDLIPPQSLESAETLAKAGTFVVDLLPEPSQLATRPDSDEAAARVIRTLAMIGGEEAWGKLRSYTDLHNATVVDELLRGWRLAEFSEAYAVNLLSHVDFGDRVYEERRWDVLPRLRHLTNLTHLKLIGNVQLADERSDLHPLADIRDLRSLEIANNELVHDLAPLVRCRALRELSLTGNSILHDLSVLARTSVNRLSLHVITKTVSGASIDLATLAGASLRHLSIAHPNLAGGLYSLPIDLPLTELHLTNRADRRSLLGISRWPTLTTVRVVGVPTKQEFEELRRLPNLSHLDLDDVSEADIETAQGVLDGVDVRTAQ